MTVVRGVTLIVSNFEVTVEKLVYGGDGLARLDGRVVFAPFVLPGERILARAEQEKPGMVRARMLEVLEAAPDRVVAPCPVYGRCGGCHYQHAPYAYQLVAKRAILVEALERLGKMAPPAEIAVVSAEPLGYRNRVQLHVEEDRIGYREARSHRLCMVGECPVGSPKINQAIAALSAMTRPTDALANSQLGMTYFELGQYDSAVKYLERAREIDPAHFSHPQLFLAEIHLRRGEKREAASVLEDFLQHHPDYPQAEKMRQNIVELQQ